MNKICWFISNGNKKFPCTSLTEKIEINIYRQDWVKNSEWWGKIWFGKQRPQADTGPTYLQVALVQGFGCGLHWLVLAQRQCCFGRRQRGGGPKWWGISILGDHPDSPGHGPRPPAVAMTLALVGAGLDQRPAAWAWLQCGDLKMLLW